MGLVSKAILLGAGYVLGARAGTDRYDQIVTLAQKIAARPEVAAVTTRVKAGSAQAASAAAPATSAAPAGPPPGPPAADGLTGVPSVTVADGPTAVPDARLSQPPGAASPPAVAGRSRLNKRPTAQR